MKLKFTDKEIERSRHLPSCEKSPLCNTTYVICAYTLCVKHKSFVLYFLNEKLTQRFLYQLILRLLKAWCIGSVLVYQTYGSLSDLGWKLGILSFDETSKPTISCGSNTDRDACNIYLFILYSIVQVTEDG